MVVDITKGSHISSFPSRIASVMGQYGHVYDLVLTADSDNGILAKRGNYISFAQYEQDDVTADDVEVTVREQNTDGSWLVEVTKLPAYEVLYVYNSPVSEYSERDLQDEALMYNKAGEVAQGATLILGDMFSLTDVAFTGTIATGAVAKFNAGKYVI